MEKHTALNSQPEKYLDLCIRWRPKSENLLGHLALDKKLGRNLVGNACLRSLVHSH